MPPAHSSSDPEAPGPEAAAGTEAPAEGSAAARPAPLLPAALALRLRRAHAAAAPWVLTPLLLTVCTGMGYRLLRDWGGLDRDQAHLLMVLHEGEWLRRWFGPNGETLYVLLNGLGLLWMLLSGGAQLARRLRRPRAEAGGERVP